MHASTKTLRNTLIAAGVALLASTLSVVAAGDLAEPTGEVILTVSGGIDANNGDGVARFDLAMLQEMPATTIATTTIWTEGDQEFTGVELYTFLQELGVESGEITATAINDYAVTLPFSDAVTGGPIIAYARNGEPMSVRDKGPLWIIYPYDASPDYRTETIFARSIWQLDRMAITE